MQNRFKKSCLIFFLIAFLPKISYAKITVLSSFKPVSDIVNEIAKDNIESRVIIGKNDSPHHYALKPSDISYIKEADVIFIISYDLEVFFTKIIKKKQLENKTIELKKVNGLKLIKLKQHFHEGHNHEAIYDDHIWLSPYNVSIMADYIAHHLAKLDPQNEAKYMDNLELFKKNLASLNDEVKSKLDKVKTIDYIVSHNAYSYFVDYYGIKAGQEITFDHEYTPSAGKIEYIENYIKNNNVRCILLENFSRSKLISNLITKYKLNSAIIGPEGENGSVGYVEFLKDLSDKFYQCLAN